MSPSFKTASFPCSVQQMLIHSQHSANAHKLAFSLFKHGHKMILNVSLLNKYLSGYCAVAGDTKSNNQWSLPLPTLCQCLVWWGDVETEVGGRQCPEGNPQAGEGWPLCW